MIFFNIKLWFSVIRYPMTSSWRHNACFFYLLCSKYHAKFQVRVKFASMCFLGNQSDEEEEEEEEEEGEEKKTEQKQ